MARSPGYDIITVGSNIVDLFVDTGLPELVKGGETFIGYPVGAKMLVRKTHIETGGGGTNTAVAFSRLGLRTGYLGNVSTDNFGEKVMAMLKKEKVEFLGTRSKDRCGFSVILDSKERHRTILVYKGASDNLYHRKINLKRLNTKWFYFSSMGGTSFETQKELARFASTHDIKLAFNPSWYQAEAGRKHLMPLLKHTELLVLNREEAEMIAGTRERPWEALSRLGPRAVCITEGEKEVRFFHDGALYGLTPHHLAPTEVTGAGDAFAAGLVFGFIREKPIEECLQLACANAESVIFHVGAKNNLLTLREAMAAVRKNPVRIRKFYLLEAPG